MARSPLHLTNYKIFSYSPNFSHKYGTCIHKFEEFFSTYLIIILNIVNKILFIFNQM